MNAQSSLLKLKPGRGISVAVALFVGLSPLLRAQTAPPPPAAADQSETETLSPEALDDLLGPIALYPDALIALILPASTVPSDVTLAARYLANGGDPNNVDDQSWDPSVKSLVRYPDVVKWMDDNLEWTTSVGDAFIAQPADVMTAIQRLRGEAQAAGNLVDTPQQKVVQQVVEKQTYISIVPAEPDVIYVPEYNPEVVYVERQPDWVGPIIGFGAGFAVGSWLNYGCDWQDRGVYYGDYRPGWDRGWNDGGNGNNYVNNNTNIVNNNVNVNNITRASAHRWQPSSQSRRQLSQHSATYNKRVKAANAEVRHHNATAGNKAASKPRRLKSLPQPTHFAANKNGKNHPNQNKNGAGKAQAGPVDRKHPGEAPNAAGNGKNNANKGNGKKPNAKAPSAAPSVAGELAKPHNNNGKNKGNGNGKGKGGNNNGNGGNNKPSSPSQAPHKPKSNPTAEAKHPSKAPNSQPASHPKKSQPSAPAPKHNQSAPKNNHPKQQAPAPSKPKGGNGGGNKAQSNRGNGGGGNNKPHANQGNGGGGNKAQSNKGNGGGGNNDKKKSDDKKKDKK